MPTERGGGQRRSAASTSTAGSRASAIPSYRDEPEVAPDSETETFVALKLAIDSWRWAGVPFYIRTGKALPSRVTEIAVQFRRAPLALFSARRRPPGRPQRARHPRPARRGHPAALRRQGAGPGAPDPDREHGLPLRVVVRGRLAGRVRDAPPRRDGRRRQPLHARRRGRAGMGRSSTRSSTRGSPARAGRSTSTAPAPGGRRRPTSCSSATGAPGAGHDASGPRSSEEQAVASAPHAVRRARGASQRRCGRSAARASARVAGHLARLWDAQAAAERRGGHPIDDREGAAARPGVGPQPHRDGRRRRGRRSRRRTRCCDLGVRHPSRAIVLVPDPAAAEAARSTRASARTATTAADGGERVCCEEVVLTVRGEAADHLAGIVAPLLIHDLPTHVWWPGDPPFRDPVFDQLVEIGDRVLVDIGRLRRPAWRAAPARGSLRRASGVGDLSLGAPGVVAGADRAVLRRAALPALPAEPQPAPDAATPSRARGCSPATERLGPGVTSPMAQALLYAGWIATRLGWRRHRTVATAPATAGFRLTLEGRHEMVDLVIEPEPTRDAAARRPRVASGSARWARRAPASSSSTAPATIAIVATNADGMTALLRRVAMETPSEAELLSAQLADGRRRPRLRGRAPRRRRSSSPARARDAA